MLGDLSSHPYPTKGVTIYPSTYGAGGIGYFVWLGLIPGIAVLLMWRVHVWDLHLLSWAAGIYLILTAVVVTYLRCLKLEIRTDGISYSNLFRGTQSITYSEIYSVSHYFDSDPGSSRWSALSWTDTWLVNQLVITPRPESSKPTIKITLDLFPSEAKDQLYELLRPQEWDVRAV
jgi:hypothetical protein